MRLFAAAHVMNQAAAAGLPLRHHDLDAVAAEHPDRRIKNRWPDHPA
jgi:hypothetical protein